MDTFWIHCNRCNMLLCDATERNIKFYVANCTHIFCQDCMTAVSQTRKCNCCPNKSLRSIGALDPTLKPEIKPFFSNVLMNTKSVHQALEYQTNQIKHLVGTYRKTIGTLGNQLRSYQQQFEGMKRQVDEARSRAAIAEEECAKLKEAVSRYQRRNSPAGANLFRPISSPVVTRKRLSQTDFLQQNPQRSNSQLSNGSGKHGFPPLTPGPLKGSSHSSSQNGFMNMGGGMIGFKSPPQPRKRPTESIRSSSGYPPAPRW